MPLAIHPELEERNFGDLRGTPYAELRVDPFVPEYDPPGGERLGSPFTNASTAPGRRSSATGSTDFASRGADAHLAVVSHGLFLRSLLERRLLSAEQLERHGDGEGRITIDNTALTHRRTRRRIAERVGRPHRVELLACTAHLDESEAPTGRPVRSERSERDAPSGVERDLDHREAVEGLRDLRLLRPPLAVEADAVDHGVPGQRRQEMAHARAQPLAIVLDRPRPTAQDRARRQYLDRAPASTAGSCADTGVKFVHQRVSRLVSSQIVAPPSAHS